MDDGDKRVKTQTTLFLSTMEVGLGFQSRPILAYVTPVKLLFGTRHEYLGISFVIIGVPVLMSSPGPSAFTKRSYRCILFLNTLDLQ